jgi:hypothetical protein
MIAPTIRTTLLRIFSSFHSPEAVYFCSPTFTNPLLFLAPCLLALTTNRGTAANIQASPQPRRCRIVLHRDHIIYAWCYVPEEELWFGLV